MYFYDKKSLFVKDDIFVETTISDVEAAVIQIASRNNFIQLYIGSYITKE